MIKEREKGGRIFLLCNGAFSNLPLSFQIDKITKMVNIGTWKSGRPITA